LKELEELASAAQEALAAAGDTKSLEDLRIRYLGRKGILTQKMKELGSLPANRRPAFGKEINIIKGNLERSIKARAQELSSRIPQANVPKDLTRRPEPDRSRARVRTRTESAARDPDTIHRVDLAPRQGDAKYAALVGCPRSLFVYRHG